MNENGSKTTGKRGSNCDDRNSNCSTNNNGGKRNNNRSSSRNTKDRSKRVNKSSKNDPAWYTRYPQLAKDASKFPFSTPLGKTVDMLGMAKRVGELNPEDPNIAKWTVTGTGNGPSGILAIKWMPTLGQSTNENSPVNIVARELYGYVRHANSGAKNYDAPDLMMYVLAMDSIYSFYANMVRVYGIMRLYSGMNRYYPKALVQALGWNFDDVSKNLAQFRWTINQFAYKLTSLYVPAGIDYFTRHIWMNSGVYTDSNNVKAQTYVFKQDRYYRYEASSDTDYRAVLKCIKPTQEYFTVGTAEAFMNSLIDPVLADEDMNIMSGDMLKAFGPQKLFTVNPIAEDYVVIPTFQPEVLIQVQNLTVFGEPYEKSVFATKQTGADVIQIINEHTFTPGIYQSIEWQPYDYSLQSHDDKSYLNRYSIMLSNRVMSIPSDDPTSDDMLVATRLTNVATTFAVVEDSSWYNGHVPTWYTDVLSTEVVMDLEITSVNKYGTYVTTDITNDFFELNRPGGNTNTEADKLALLAAFNFNPGLKIISYDSSEGTAHNKWYLHGSLQQTENFTVVENQDLGRLHETALMSLVYVPSVQV